MKLAIARMVDRAMIPVGLHCAGRLSKKFIIILKINFFFSCQPGWSGPFCEEAENCSLHGYCHNGGICVDDNETKTVCE